MALYDENENVVIKRRGANCSSGMVEEEISLITEETSLIKEEKSLIKRERNATTKTR